MISIPAVAQKLYKTVDKDGNVVYTDTPPADQRAKEIKLPTPNITPSLSMPKLNLDIDDPEPAGYNELIITSPSHDSTVFINQNNLSIQIESIPVIKTSKGHALQILLDGKIISAGARTSMLVDQIDRGTHTVQARIVDDTGKTLLNSDSVVVHIRQTIKPPPPPPKKKSSAGA